MTDRPDYLRLIRSADLPDSPIEAEVAKLQAEARQGRAVPGLEAIQRLAAAEDREIHDRLGDCAHGVSMAAACAQCGSGRVPPDFEWGRDLPEEDEWMGRR